MKKLAIAAIISVFLIFNSSIILAQGFPLPWQLPNFYGQYNQPWGFQQYTPGYSSLFNPISQYGQQWGFQSYVPGYSGSFNSVLQPWSQQQRFSSRSSSQLLLNSEPIYGQNGQFYIPGNSTSGLFNRDPLYNWNSYRNYATSSDVVPGIPSFSAITYNPSMGAYYAPGWIPVSSYLRPGAWVGVTDLNGGEWSLHLFADSAMLVQAGTGKAITKEGTSQIKIITIEDDGETFTFKPGEMFRIVLPMYDNIEGVDFPQVAGWEHEGMWGTNYVRQAVYQYGYEPMEIGISKDEDGNLVQENTYRSLKESQYATQLVFHYHGSDNPNDTFTVTIKIKGTGNYEPVFNSGSQF
ncbi:MAG: hypothetical protein ACMUIU_03455 [bacterium]